MRDTETQEREKQAPCREPDAGPDPRTWDHGPPELRQTLNR